MLNDKVLSLNGDRFTFQKVGEKHNGKIIMIDVWVTLYGHYFFKTIPNYKEITNSTSRDVVIIYIY
ncbi:hypothetical protein BTO06_12725 [Tenacibaculum sp. SZ-18]|nr:hypothetical protein BTO06_12725 [Tenacibaculum sp. SZ-18]